MDVQAGLSHYWAHKLLGGAMRCLSCEHATSDSI